MADRTPATSPTPYPEVNVLLEQLLTGVQAILGQRLVGLYLDGSLATGNFEPDRSDVDFVALTDGDLPADRFVALQALHTHLAAGGSRWATELEGSYIPGYAIRHHDTRPRQHPYIDRGSGHLGLVHQESGYWVIHRHVLREHGIALVGPAPRTLIDPVYPLELRRAVSGIVQEWWAPMLENSARLGSWGYRCYAVLTMCRMLYTLEHGTIVAKSVAARWVAETQEARWAPLLRDALAWSAETAPDLSLTLDLIRLTRERSRLV